MLTLKLTATVRDRYSREASEAERARTESGYSSVRVSKQTLAGLKALQETIKKRSGMYRHLSLDELLGELAAGVVVVSKRAEK